MADWNVTADQVKPGDKFRQFGRGFRMREAVSVEHMCNCKCPVGKSIDPATGKPQHYPIVLIRAQRLAWAAMPSTTVTLTNGEY